MLQWGILKMSKPIKELKEENRQLKKGITILKFKEEDDIKYYLAGMLWDYGIKVEFNKLDITFTKGVRE